MRKRKTLKRERVNRSFAHIFNYRLTIVEAPIGYGKTTAVKEFLSTRENPVLWISFQSAEDSAAYFWQKFVKEISRVDELTGTRLRSLGFPSDASQTATILSILENLDFVENTVMVIDDFHLAKDVRIGVFLARMIREELDSCHIVVITRDTSNIEFAELSAKGLCNILPQQTLRFTSDEIKDYCSLMGYMPDDAEMHKLIEYTGGWISLVYLILLGMEQGISVGRNSIIDELVEKVLYNAYDQSVRHFLLRLSVMESFTAEQARYVTDDKRTFNLLKKLRRENAFIAYDESAGVYEIHNVLLDFLRTQQTNDNERADLYRRLGAWYFSQGAFIRAYAQLYRAGETERILAHLDNEDTITNDFAGFEGALAMFETTPGTLLFQYPLAYLQYIALLFLSGDPASAQNGLACLDELQSVYEAAGCPHPHRKNRILAEINAIRIFAAFNDGKKMIDYRNKAIRLLEGGTSCLLKQKNEFTFGSPHLLYSYYRESGGFKETADLIVSAFPGVDQLTGGGCTGFDHVALAEYALETGDWQEAELNACKTIYLAKPKGQTSIVICANLTLIRLYIYQGKISEALERLKQLNDDVTKVNNAIYNTTLELVKGYVHACLGQLDNIPEWLRTGDMSPARFMYQGMAFNYIVHGKTVLLARNDLQLEMLTETLMQHFSVFHNHLGFLHNRIFEAVAKYRLHGIEEGCMVLRQALDMVREDHIILPFAEYAPAIIDMMLHMSVSNQLDTFLQEALLACRQYLESLKQVKENENPLSARELEVLTLASEGLKRNEIAGRLMVSAGTVQTHLHNIYVKLEVSGKTAAIKKSQKLKIL